MIGFADGSTPARILAAAADEFAERGLAGARVDRIAERASANKQRLYAYFTSKDLLFDAVVEHRIDQFVDAVPFDADDLPGYAVRLLDFNLEHPELVRLLLWHTLERPGVLERLPEWGRATTAKVGALQASLDRRGTADVSAERLLTQVLGLVHGLLLVPGAAQGAVREDLAAAVRTLVGD
ncbi:TetR family transcriptional regulator [Cellulomonas sp.]|uniref:TetR/AcrR family transcriptional regulator n=1 Tax=Cellulomonas sp. TaxID=40001 RepID=UPI001B212F87|nr:TetR family transcriptional regulator [Cellulomonas sp.]MBO9554602.1 TetR family transcriptional regulator [Cellulomonas sp.]